jgi:tRNA wybutosine-synthesizing protein 2
VTRPGPVDRVRARLARDLPGAAVDELPGGYERLGRVVIVKLPETLRPHFSAIGEAYRHELAVATVLRRAGPIRGDFRLPAVEVLAGSSTTTEVIEHGIRYRFDAARMMFSAGNRTERRRAGDLVRPGEVVADLFAGIGYFTIPAARPGHAERVFACEANPESFRALEENLRVNHVLDRVTAFSGPNEAASLPDGGVDRVFLGYLPSAVPWVGRAVPLLRSEGGWLHVHHVEGVRGGPAEAAAVVRAAVERSGGAVTDLRAREVKPYGPGRLHAVVDVEVRPPQ